VFEGARNEDLFVMGPDGHFIDVPHPYDSPEMLERRARALDSEIGLSDDPAKQAAARDLVVQAHALRKAGIEPLGLHEISKKISTESEL
jgi:hypothetical protein